MYLLLQSLAFLFCSVYFYKLFEFVLFEFSIYNWYQNLGDIFHYCDDI